MTQRAPYFPRVTKQADTIGATNGRKMDPLDDPAATDALVATLGTYIPPTTDRGRRKERLRKIVATLAAKGCSINEMLRVLNKSGVRTCWRTVRNLLPDSTSQIQFQTSPRVEPGEARTDHPGQEHEPASPGRTEQGLRQVQI
jgi:hypothetical protein